MKSPRTAFKKYLCGTVAVLPLAFAVAPWGVLAGSMAIESHLTPLQGIGMSVFMFAGAAQLATLGMLNAGAGLVSIIITVSLITSRHLLYAASMRDKIADKPTLWRVILGFVLTDEFFALNSGKGKEHFDVWYAVGVGFSFYLLWVFFTIVGVFLGKSIPNLSNLGLDFSIAATFIAIIVPLVRDLSTILCVSTALICSVAFTAYGIEPALLLSGLLGMFVGFICRKWWEKKE